MSAGVWWRIAWRNLWRNPRRTVITASALAFGFMAAVVIVGISDAVTRDMVENGTKIITGEVQIHASDYRPERSLYATLGGREGVDLDALRSFASRVEGVRSVTVRVYGGGLVFLMSGFRGSALQAIRQADAEGDVTGTGTVAWTFDRDTPYVPSPLLYGDRLYFSKVNTGILSCLDAGSGEVLFQERLDGISNVYASPVGAAGRVYLAGREGTTLVLEVWYQDVTYHDSSTSVLLVTGAANFVAGVLGGMAAAALGGRWPLASAAVVGAFVILDTVSILRSDRWADPAWFTVLAGLGLLTAALLGAWLVRRLRLRAGAPPREPVRIRPMRASDLPAALEILDRWNMAPTPDRDDAERSGIVIENAFVAVQGDRVVGTAGWFPIGDETAETASLAVDPAFRGLGIGYRLQAALPF